ncbi:hypothetical protein CONPUDRAFT_170319 [Coniophora puteana RWD-64-598 SS2]|uniref:Uncharacterized protein n=1 Tax=Coniophora puteana (strain RWD-64-598) TaxID=741705 RepID=R7SGE5_CONPW|nr:uncharacterized protein CONPUDRAFT_170319 [Coniophora puteana RWD-64-598 SS2]EIW74154.1 hypothetical protein CONPUDRAFT_170319 [Coniophora puteana RWD-64-598 SS2]
MQATRCQRIFLRTTTSIDDSASSRGARRFMRQSGRVGPGTVIVEIGVELSYLLRHDNAPPPPGAVGGHRYNRSMGGIVTDHQWLLPHGTGMSRMYRGVTSEREREIIAAERQRERNLEYGPVPLQNPPQSSAQRRRRGACESSST